MGAIVVVGGTAGIGRAVAEHFVGQGREVVLTGREPDRAKSIAAELGATAGLGFDLSQPETIGPALADVGAVDHVVLMAIDRDQNTVGTYDLAQALHLVTLKLVGYTEVVHTLRPRLNERSSVLVFGGLAKDRPYPGSTTVSTVNAGVLGLTRSVAIELAPIRVNSLHPGIVGDSPFWSDKPAEVLEGHRKATLTGRLAATKDIVGAVAFLLDNPSANDVHLAINGGIR
jgi:NAD(P)-dependent dehydrogenase (short-subunit alcohol dehydrogenase family)